MTNENLLNKGESPNVLSLTRSPHLTLERLLTAVMNGLQDEEVRSQLASDPVWWLFPLSENLPPLVCILAPGGRFGDLLNTHSALIKSGFAAISHFWEKISLQRDYSVYELAADKGFDRETLNTLADLMRARLNDETPRMVGLARWNSLVAELRSYDVGQAIGSSLDMLSGELTATANPTRLGIGNHFNGSFL